MIESDKPNVELILPNMRVVKEYNKLILNVDKNEVINYKEELKDCVETPCGIIKLIDEDKKDKSNYIIRLNSKDIRLPLYVRNRKDGDKIHVKNMDGTKKINDIFIDNKVSKYLRDVYPIIVDSDDKIIFIPGIKKSNLDIPIDKEYDIIIKYILEE